MLKRGIIPIALLLLYGCNEHKTPEEQVSQASFVTFMEYHNNACRCVLDSMPHVKQVLRKEGSNGESLFCLWSSFMCANSKTRQTLQDSAQLIDSLGEFSCNSIEHFTSAAQERNIDAMCGRFWTIESMTYIQRLVHLTNTCDDLYGPKTDCICTVRSYIASISDEEYRALNQRGYAVLSKLQNAATKCPK